MKKRTEPTRLDKTVGQTVVGGLAATMGGAILVIPFYGFLPLICVVGGLFAVVYVGNLIESPEARQQRFRENERS